MIHSTCDQRLSKYKFPKKVFGEPDFFEFSWTSRVPSCQQRVAIVFFWVASWPVLNQTSCGYED